nr:uncharacterized protein LOC122268758 [Parasteatoda tepidariorum]
MDGENGNSSKTGPAMPELSPVAVKVPQFWKENPAIWFSRVESQFITAGITQDSTKYHTIVASIETDILSQVSDIITSPPVRNMYDSLKQRLIEIFSISEERRLKKLLQDIALGDRRPSALLRQMKDLAGDRVGDALLKSLWLQRLPTQMQAILSTSSDPLNKLATMENKIADVTFSNEIFPASSGTKQKVPNDGEYSNIIESLQAQVCELNKKLDKVLRFRGRSSDKNMNKHRNRSTSKNRLCWYHFRFRERVNKCIQPCSFKQEN